jgi:hypothetical protein
MRIDDLGQDGIGLCDFERVGNHVAPRISQPCRGFIALEHEYSFFRPRRPNVLLLYAGIQRKHRPHRKFIHRRKTDLEFVTKPLVFETDDDPARRTFALQAYALTARPKYTGSSALLRDRACQAAFRGACDQHQ